MGLSRSLYRFFTNKCRNEFKSDIHALNIKLIENTYTLLYFTILYLYIIYHLFRVLDNMINRTNFHKLLQAKFLELRILYECTFHSLYLKKGPNKI